MKLAFRSQKDQERFMTKIVKREDGCWEWIAARYSKGYGQFTIGEFNLRANRVSHWNFNGPFDETLDVKHSCDRPWCVCPDHLSDGTNQENRDESYARGRGNIGERNGMSSLNDKKVLEIRALYETGNFTKAELSKMFNISPSVLGGVVNRKSWTHV